MPTAKTSAKASRPVRIKLPAGAAVWPELAAVIAAAEALIPEVDRTSAAHSLIDSGQAEGDEEAAERTWHRALRRFERALEALLSVKPRTVAEANTKADAYALLYAKVASKKNVTSVATAMKLLERDDNEKPLLDALLRDLRALGSVAPPPPVSPAPSTWDNACAAYDEIATRCMVLDNQHDEATDRTHKDEIERQIEALDQPRCDALTALENTPAPTVWHLMQTMRRSINFWGLQWAWEDADDPRTIARMLSSGDAHEIIVAQTWLQVLRLAGENSPALTAKVDPNENYDQPPPTWERPAGFVCLAEEEQPVIGRDVLRDLWIEARQLEGVH